jgi:hypothetical protein
MTPHPSGAQATADLTRSRSAAAAFRSACRVMAVLDVLLPGDEEVGRLAGARAYLEERFNKLTTLEPGSGPFNAMLRELEHGVVLMEQELSKADAEIPMPWFRLHFDPRRASSEALADYASVLGRNAGDDPARLDRVQLLLTRLVHNFMGSDGVKSPSLRSLLSEALPPSQVDNHTRNSAVAFFREAARRLASFKSLSELTQSGFFVDTRGYKLSLRKNILDPEVMATVIEFNEGISAAIDRLAKSDVPNDAALEAHMADVDQRIRQLFKDLRTDDPAAMLDFEKRVAKNTARKKKPKPKAWTAPRRPGARKDSRLKWQYPVIVIGLIVFWVTLPADKNLVELPPNDVMTYSPVLVSASLSPTPPRPPKLLLGHVNKSRWALMSMTERRDAAEQLSIQLDKHGLEAATVTMEGQVVMQINRGALLLVQ